MPTSPQGRTYDCRVTACVRRWLYWATSQPRAAHMCWMCSTPLLGWTGSYTFLPRSALPHQQVHIRTYPLLPGMMHFLSHGRIPVPYCTLVTRCLPVTGLSGGGAGPAWSLPGGSAAAHPASHLQQPRSGEGVYCSEGNVNVGPLPAVSEDTSLTGCC